MTRIFTRDTRGATLKQHDAWIDSLRHEPCGVTLCGLLACLALALAGAAFVYFTLHTI